MTNENKTRKQLAAISQQIEMYESMVKAATAHIETQKRHAECFGTETYISEHDFMVERLQESIDELAAEQQILAEELGI